MHDLAFLADRRSLFLIRPNECSDPGRYPIAAFVVNSRALLHSSVRMVQSTNTYIKP